MQGDTKTVLGEQPLPGYHVVLARNATPADLAFARARRIGAIFEREGKHYVIRAISCDDLKRLIAHCELIGGGQ